MCIDRIEVGSVDKEKDASYLFAAFTASCFLGALPPVDLRAVCLVRAIVGIK